HRRHGTRLLRLAEERMSVMALAAKRDEELSGAERAGIDRYAREARVAAGRAALDRLRGFRQAHHGAPRVPAPRVPCAAPILAAAASTASRSENGRRRPANSW